MQIYEKKLNSSKTRAQAGEEGTSIWDVLLSAGILECFDYITFNM